MSIAPDRRVAWLTVPVDASARRFQEGAVGWASPQRGWTDPAATVAIDTESAMTPDEVLDAITDEMHRACVGNPLSIPPIGLCLLMWLWDSEFRTSGLFASNVYLASSRSVWAIAEITDWRLPEPASPDGFDRVLRGMCEAELLYQFPVALKFRGEYGPDRQLRLNCWGRRLAERLARGCLAPDVAVARETIREHLSEHYPAYERHMSLLGHIDSEPAGIAWESAMTLPVGVLT
ncbi:hypothetical protein [Nocardia sp. NBC_01377]|uniref:hypothetical protein n=1 Tax=Nocardia sp. NBC_01377 TaxID=2903595 RepID=UPI00386C7D82